MIDCRLKQFLFWNLANREVVNFQMILCVKNKYSEASINLQSSSNESIHRFFVTLWHAFFCSRCTCFSPIKSFETLHQNQKNYYCAISFRLLGRWAFAPRFGQPEIRTGKIFEIMCQWEKVDKWENCTLCRLYEWSIQSLASIII